MDKDLILQPGAGYVHNNESYSERFEHNQKTSDESQERLGDCFFDWWAEIWCKKSTGTAANYSGEYGMEELQAALNEKFPYQIIVDQINKPLDSLSECMTNEWTCLTWDNKQYAYFETEEDKVKFILFST